MALSSVQSIAGSGLLPVPPVGIGKALAINADFLTEINTYRAQPVLVAYRDVIEACSNNAPAALSSLRNMGREQLPGVIDALPEPYLFAEIYPASPYSVDEYYTTGDQVVYTNAIWKAVDASQGISPRTPYIDSQTYNTNDIVSYDEVIYRALSTTTGNLPTDPTYWARVSADPWELLLPSTAYLSDIIIAMSERLVDEEDLTKFCQIFSSAVGYVSQVNGVIDANNASAVISNTYNPSTGGMDTLTTGGLNQVSNDLKALSRDLFNLGSMLNFANLNDLGLPGELLAQIGRVSGGEIPAIVGLLESAGIDTGRIQDLSLGDNQLTNAEEKLAYQVMLGIKGDTLDQVKFLLKVQLDNITNMAEMLDPKMYLPNSYLTLLCPTNDNLLLVYPDGFINTDLEALFVGTDVDQYTGPNNTNSYSILNRIIPSDQALGNKAFARSLQQVKQIQNSTPQALSRAMNLVETNNGLADINSLTVPIPDIIKSTYEIELAYATGPDGRMTLTDIVGTPSGVDITNDYVNTVLDIELLQTAGAFDVLTNSTDGLYTVMLKALDTNDYVVATPDPMDPMITTYQIVIPSGLPGAGTYPAAGATTLAQARQDALTGNGTGVGLIAAGNTIFDGIVAANAELALRLDQDYTYIADYVSRNTENLQRAEIDINFLSDNSRTNAMLFAESLHEYGVDVSAGGANAVITALADITTVSGQAVVASLREGRNIKSLEAAGIQLDTQL